MASAKQIQTTQTIETNTTTTTVKELTVDEKTKEMLLKAYKIIELTNGAIIVNNVAPFKEASIDSVSIKKLSEVYKLLTSDKDLPKFIEKLKEVFGKELEQNKEKIANCLFDILLIIEETRQVVGQRFERTELGSRYLTVDADVIDTLGKILKVAEKVKLETKIDEREAFIKEINALY